MPTVLVVDGFAVRVYLPPREHRPPHVHVVKSDSEVVILLGGPGAPPAVREVHGMRDADVVRAYRIVEAHRDALLEAWSRYHD